MKTLLLLVSLGFSAISYGQKSYHRDLVVVDPCIGNDIYSQSANAGFEIFPNPSTGVINLSLPENGTAIVTDLKGVLITQQNVESKDQLELSGLSAGVYLLTLVSESRIFRTKLILEK